MSQKPIYNYNGIEKPRPNTYACNCVNCGTLVPDGKGMAERNYQWFRRPDGGYDRELVWCMKCIQETNENTQSKTD